MTIILQSGKFQFLDGRGSIFDRFVVYLLLAIAPPHF